MSTRPVLAPARLAGAVLATLLAIVVLAAPAGAHSEDGRMTVTAAEPAGAGAVRVEVGIVYANDDDLAEEATVSAVLTGPAGQQVGPVPLNRTTGALYSSEVAVPAGGDWQVAVTSTSPAAEATATVTVVDAPAETSTSTTSAPVAADVAASAAPIPADEGDDSFPIGVVALAAAAVLVVVAGGVVLARRRG